MSSAELVPQEQRGAKFVCTLALADASGKTVTVSGECAGRIAFAPSGANGFGYDPLFIPEGHTVSFAELSSEAKNAISHRGRALAQLPEILRDFL